MGISLKISRGTKKLHFQDGFWIDGLITCIGACCRSASQAYWFEKKVTQLMMDDENEMNEKIKNLDLLQKNKLPDGIQLSPALSWMFIIDHSSDTLINRQMNHWEPPAEVGSMDDAIDAKEADQESSREVEEKSTAYLHRLREDFEQGLRIQYSVWDDDMSRLKEFYSSFHCFYQVSLKGSIAFWV